MKILQISVIIFITFSCSITNSRNQNSDTTWSRWQYLIGTWKGTNSGEPGQGEGYFTFGFELGENILIRKGHTVFPGHENQPARIHDDVLIIYKENSSVPDKAEYFDSEGHVLHYNISYTNNDIIIFTTNNTGEGNPIFRLSIIKMDNVTTGVKFEAAPSDHPDDFKVHVEGTVIKIN